MNKKENLIGCHVSFKKKDYFIGSVSEAISYGANCFMIYTGPPQNSQRSELDQNNIFSAHDLLKKNNISLDNIIVHMPYIINLASDKDITYLLAKKFLIDEIKRTELLGLKYIVLHPGCKLSLSTDEAIRKIADAINYVFEVTNTKIWILLETMAGKGSEIGSNFSELKKIIDLVNIKQVGVCLDTCHLFDSGIDISNPEKLLNEFDNIIGIDLLKAIHLNDSKNEFGSKKDRHENIGYGKIGFEIISKWYSCPKLNNIPKILETPHFALEKKDIPIYKEEIEMLRSNSWYDVKTLLSNK